MTAQVQELYVFRARQTHSEDSSLRYWKFVRNNARSDYSPGFTNKPDEATFFQPDDYKNIVALYKKLMGTFDPDDVEFVKVTVSVDIETIPMDSDVMMDERRRVALSKLSQDDILALGVESHAVYSKLKFHKAPNPLDDVMF